MSTDKFSFAITNLPDVTVAEVFADNQDYHSLPEPVKEYLCSSPMQNLENVLYSLISMARTYRDEKISKQENYVRRFSVYTVNINNPTLNALEPLASKRLEYQLSVEYGKSWVHTKSLTFGKSPLETLEKKTRGDQHG